MEPITIMVDFFILKITSVIYPANGEMSQLFHRKVFLSFNSLVILEFCTWIRNNKYCKSIKIMRQEL
jgi:hypothetical protein